MRTRLRITLLLLLGALVSGVLLLTLQFGRLEERSRISNPHWKHGDREQQQYRQYEVLPDDLKKENRGTPSWSKWTRLSQIWNSNEREEVKTYPNLAQCRILHHRTSSSANITSLSLLLDPNASLDFETCLTRGATLFIKPCSHTSDRRARSC